MDMSTFVVQVPSKPVEKITSYDTKQKKLSRATLSGAAIAKQQEAVRWYLPPLVRKLSRYHLGKCYTQSFTPGGIDSRRQPTTEARFYGS